MAGLVNLIVTIIISALAEKDTILKMLYSMNNNNKKKPFNTDSMARLNEIKDFLVSFRQRIGFIRPKQIHINKKQKNGITIII